MVTPARLEEMCRNRESPIPMVDGGAPQRGVRMSDDRIERRREVVSLDASA